MTKKIYKFEEFSKGETLHIFDFDDTLVNTPSFEELAINFLKESKSISDLLKSSIERIGASMSELKWENGRIYIDDPYEVKKEWSNWVRKGGRLYMTTPNVFHHLDISLPTSLKELSYLYKQNDQKCIVTARSESLRPKIENILRKFNLGMPKFGLHMAPEGQKNLGTWKGEKIVEIINSTGFREAIFYDDNQKYIKNATKVVREKLPNFLFKTVKA